MLIPLFLAACAPGSDPSPLDVLADPDSTPEGTTAACELPVVQVCACDGVWLDWGGAVTGVPDASQLLLFDYDVATLSDAVCGETVSQSHLLDLHEAADLGGTGWSVDLSGTPALSGAASVVVGEQRGWVLLELDAESTNTEVPLSLEDGTSP